jgi:predicted nucleic acid-binding protein
MMACLDTTFLIDLGRSRGELHRRASRRLEELAVSGEILVTTQFNVAELYVGVQLASDAERELKSVEQLLRDLEILDFDDRAAWLFAESTAHLRRLGRPAGDMDVLIAATAMANGHGLVTRNPAHFADIPLLQVDAY